MCKFLVVAKTRQWCLIISKEIFIILVWRKLNMFNFFILKWKSIKSLFFVKYTAILIWSFKNDHFKMIVFLALIICNEHTLRRSANLFSRNHFTLCFWLIREGRRCPILKSYFIKLTKAALQLCWQETPTQVFYCCETFKSANFEEHLRTAFFLDSRFENQSLNTIGAYVVFIFNPYASIWT